MRSSLRIPSVKRMRTSGELFGDASDDDSDAKQITRVLFEGTSSDDSDTDTRNNEDQQSDRVLSKTVSIAANERIPLKSFFGSQLYQQHLDADYDYVSIPMNTLLYRGTAHDKDVSDQHWYTSLPHVANIYKEDNRATSGRVVEYISMRLFKMLNLNSVKNLVKFDALDPTLGFNHVHTEGSTFNDEPPLALYNDTDGSPEFSKVIRISNSDEDNNLVTNFFQIYKGGAFKYFDGFEWPDGTGYHHQEFYFFENAEDNHIVRVHQPENKCGSPRKGPLKKGGTRVRARARAHRKHSSTNKRPRTARNTHHRTPRRCRKATRRR